MENEKGQGQKDTSIAINTESWVLVLGGHPLLMEGVDTTHGWYSLWASKTTVQRSNPPRPWSWVSHSTFPPPPPMVRYGVVLSPSPPPVVWYGVVLSPSPLWCGMVWYGVVLSPSPPVVWYVWNVWYACYVWQVWYVMHVWLVLYGW